MMTVNGNWKTYRISRSQLKQEIQDIVREKIYEFMGWTKEY